jgi:hypothetical protein
VHGELAELEALAADAGEFVEAGLPDERDELRLRAAPCGDQLPVSTAVTVTTGC